MAFKLIDIKTKATKRVEYEVRINKERKSGQIKFMLSNKTLDEVGWKVGDKFLPGVDEESEMVGLVKQSNLGNQGNQLSKSGKSSSKVCFTIKGKDVESMFFQGDVRIFQEGEWELKNKTILVPMAKKVRR